MFLLPAAAFAAPPSGIDAVFSTEAEAAGVPPEILLAIAWEASRLDPAAESRWGGYGLFDLREGDLDPSLEHAAALIEVDPNALAADWRLQVKGAAALLAEHGAAANGGVRPAVTDLAAWWNAVRAFSGREEPNLQNLYARGIYDVVGAGFYLKGAAGLLPRAVDTSPYEEPPPPPSSMDYSGAASWYAACGDNYTDDSRGSGDIDMIVIHTVQGSYSGCAAWFANCSAGASAHYVVRSSDGQVTQMVREADVAWHAGNWDYNTRSVGIEHEGYVSDCAWYTDAMYAGSAALATDIAKRQGVSLDRSHVIGHNEVPDPDGSGWGGAGHHTDPGSCWDWDYYMSLLGGSSGSSGGEIIGVVADGDIYNGTRLVGATVWLEQTGETTTVESDGYYRFSDVPWGSYTVHASHPGYNEGTCAKTTSGEQDWCSIALTPASETEPEPETETETETDTASTDTPEATDTGLGAQDPDRRSPRGPGKLVEMEQAGRTCSSAGGAGWLALLALPLLRRR